jgi:AMMECR1 domain-containing protein
LTLQVERHGVIIEFVADGRNYSATYLPDVALEQGWDQREAINSLIKKSGYNGWFRTDPSSDPSLDGRIYFSRTSQFDQVDEISIIQSKLGLLGISITSICPKVRFDFHIEGKLIS